MKYEYCTMTRADLNLHEIANGMNNLGTKGWELISSIYTGTAIILFFKRPTP